ncbi:MULTISPECIES: huazacin family RiPP peptide [Paenibacillus]|nr:MULTISPECIES: huazacin family RiPP peptide [unclassified Paenibacillus]QLG38044.1 huazacin family RiPP peptide [Paenibacillus sp. E222]UPK43613.1 huazacin family RiPP peptide [Paenibacillus pabuli]
MRGVLSVAVLFCQVKCVGTCAAACAADLVSPVADVFGFAAGEARFFSM